MTFLPIVFLLILFAVEFIYSGFVASMDEITEAEITEVTEDKTSLANHFQRFKDHTYLYRNAYYTFTVVLSMLVFVVSDQMIFDFSTTTGMIRTIVGFILVVLLFLSFGIFLPYFVCRRDPKRFIVAFFYLFRWTELVFTPLLLIMNSLSIVFAKPFGSDVDIDPDDVTEDDLISLVNESHEDGSILASEATMIQNVLSFDDKDVKDIMIHRNDMICIRGESTLEETISFVIKNHFSRYPVYGEDLDDILGAIHIKDVLDLSQQKNLFHTAIIDIPNFVFSIDSVPETRGIHTLFTTMQLDKSHLAIVVDEYGQTAGLVALEDIVEEIVGNIQDEHDEEKDSISKVSERVYMMEGRTSLAEASEELGTTLEANDVQTLNGMLISILGRVPAEHETFKITAQGYHFHVLDVENNVIQSVRVIRQENQQNIVAEGADS